MIAKISKILILTALSSIAVVGCSKESSKYDFSESKTIILDEGEKKVITMGTSADYPPFEFKKQGEFIGVDIEIARAITAKAGYKLEIVDMDFSSLVGAVKSNRVDFIMAALTETPERLKNINFSNIYYQAKISAIYTEKGQSYENLKDFGHKKVGVQLGSIMELYIKKLEKEDSNIEIMTLNKNPELIQELKLGRLDVVILEEAQAVEFSKKNPKLSFNTLPNTGDGYAIGFRKDSGLKDMFNEALRELQENGTLKKINNKWLKN